jgi:hypothetical protein
MLLLLITYIDGLSSNGYITSTNENFAHVVAFKKNKN